MNVSEPVAIEPSVEQIRGGSARISGTLVPKLMFELDGTGGVFFEHHTLLWKDASLNVELKKLPGGLKRKIAGLDFFLTQTRGPGRIAFSHDAPGKIVDHHLQPGQALLVREHHFVAATENLDYTFERVKGVRSMLFGGSGFFVDRFAATNGVASVWVMGSGDVFHADLEAGEQIDIEAGSWLYRDPSVRMEAVTMGLKTGHVRRRRQADLEPLHRPRPRRHPDDVLEPGGPGRGRRRNDRGGGRDRRHHRRPGQGRLTPPPRA